MRFHVLCLALAGVCTLAPTSLTAAGQQKPAPPPPPTTANPAVTTPARQTPPTRSATPPPPPATPLWRGVVTINGLFQPGQHDFTDTREFSYHRETATVTSDYLVEGGGGIDAGVFVRVWRHLGVGASVSSVVRTSDANISARYPHPFFFSQLRPAETSVGDLDRAEVGVHLSAAYILPSTGKFGGVVYAGPSFFNITQNAVETLTVNETYPYDTVTIAPSGEPTEISESAVGFHAGADVAWYFTNRFGVGAMARYTSAKKDVAIGTGNNFDLEAGGFQAGLGLRIRF